MKRNHPSSWLFTYASRAVGLLSVLLCACGSQLVPQEFIPQELLSGMLPEGVERPSDRARAPESSVMLDGATLLVSADSKLAVAIEPNQALVHFVQMEDRSIQTLRLEAGSEPSRPVEDSQGRIHLLLRGPGDVLSIRRTGAVIARRRVCEEVTGLAVFPSPGEEQLKVVCGSGKIVTLATEGLRARAVHSLGYDDLRDPIVVNGELWVSVFRRARVLRIGADGTVREALDMPAYQAPGDTEHSLAARVAWRLIKLPDSVGGAAVLHQQHVMGFTGDYWCTPPNCPEGHITRINRSFKITGGGHLFGTSLPVDGAVSRSGVNMMVMAAGNIQMPVPGAPPPKESPLRWGPLSGLAVKPGLAGLAPPAGKALKPVAVAAFESDGFVFLTREPRSLFVIKDARDAKDPKKWTEIALAPGVVQPDLSLDLFQAAAPSRGPCASCHPNGREDAVAVQLDMNNANQRIRRTQPLNIGLKETLPLHWDGKLSTLPVLVAHDLKSFGLPEMDPGDAKIQSFSAWLDGQPRSWRHVPPEEQPAVDAGVRVFAAQGCAGCHDPSYAFSTKENKSVDEKEPAYQVPSLRGVSFRAPYFHDGCAAELRQVFDGSCAKPGSGGAKAHNLAAIGLPSTSVDNLITYLGTL